MRRRLRSRMGSCRSSPSIAHVLSGVTRLHVQLHRGVVHHRRRERPLHAEPGHVQQCPRAQLGEQNDVCHHAPRSVRCGPHLCEGLSPDSFLPLGASVLRTTSHLSKQRWSQSPHSAGPRQCSELLLTCTPLPGASCACRSDWPLSGRPPPPRSSCGMHGPSP